MEIEDAATIKQAANKTGLPISKVRSLATSGKVDAEKLGSKRQGIWLISLPELQKYLGRGGK